MIAGNGQRMQVALLTHHRNGLAQGLFGLLIAFQAHQRRRLLVQTVGGRQAAAQLLLQFIGLLGIVQSLFLLCQ